MSLGTTYGRDVWSLDDLDPTREAEDAELVAQDVYWRIQTPRGMGILGEDAPDYGIDLEGMVGSAVSELDAASLPGRITAEIRKDDRIEPQSIVVTVTRTVVGPAVELAITIKATLETGETFELVVGVSDAGVAMILLSTGAA